MVMAKRETTIDLPWLDRLAVSIPGYGGYRRRDARSAADQALREAVTRRLLTARGHLESAKRECQLREVTTECEVLDRIEQDLDRILDRLKSAFPIPHAFTQAADLDDKRANALHSADLALLERADLLSRRFDMPDLDHDRLAAFRAGLRDFETLLDQRALMLEGVR
jgi:hypothetical protein